MQVTGTTAFHFVVALGMIHKSKFSSLCHPKSSMGATSELDASSVVKDGIKFLIAIFVL